MKRALQLLGMAAMGAALALAQPTMPVRAMPTGEPEVMEGGYVKLGFERLAAFPFTVPPWETKPGQALETGEEQIPAAIKAFSGSKTAVTGFMLPVKMTAGLVTEFLLVSDPSLCCYGMVPNMNEWIVVRMNGAGVKPLMDVPITLYGELRVGALFENGYLTGIYELKGERLTVLGG